MADNRKYQSDEGVTVQELRMWLRALNDDTRIILESPGLLVAMDMDGPDVRVPCINDDDEPDTYMEHAVVLKGRSIHEDDAP